MSKPKKTESSLASWRGALSLDYLRGTRVVKQGKRGGKCKLERDYDI